MPSVRFHFLFSAGILQRNILSSTLWNAMLLVSLIQLSVFLSLVEYSEHPRPFVHLSFPFLMPVVHTVGICQPPARDELT